MIYDEEEVPELLELLRGEPSPPFSPVAQGTRAHDLDAHSYSDASCH